MTRDPRLSTAARRAMQRAVRALAYSIDEVARELHVTPGTLFNWRNGRTRVTRGAVRRLAGILRRQARVLDRLYRDVKRASEKRPPARQP